MMLKSKFSPSILVILLLAAAVRFYNVDIPFIEPFNNISRQAMCASVARNYWKDGYNIFRPGLDWGGPGFNLYNVELPINTYLMSLGYLLVNKASEGFARSISIIFGLLLILYLYKVFLVLADRRVALWSAALLSISPIFIALSRSIQPDIVMSAMMTCGMYYFLLYVQSKRLCHAVLVCLSLLIAVLVRPFALLLVIPMAVAAYKRDGFTIIKNIVYYIIAVSALAGLLWYLYMWILGQSQDLYYNPYTSKRGLLAEGASYLSLFSFSSLKQSMKVLLLHSFTPLGSAFFGYGLYKRVKYEGRYVVYAWIFGALLYLLLMWHTAVNHSYYLLPLIIPASYFFGVGADQFFKTNLGRSIAKSKWAILILVCFQIGCIGYYYRLIYFIPPERMKIIYAAEDAKILIPKNDLIVASWGGSPIQLYYADRKGWALDAENNNSEFLIHELERLRGKGAKWYITSTSSEVGLNKDFIKYLKHKYEIVKDEGPSLVVSLSNRKHQESQTTEKIQDLHLKDVKHV